MKKIILIIGIIAMLVFAACSQEEPTPSPDEDLPIIDDPFGQDDVFGEQETEDLPDVLAIVNGEEIRREKVLQFQTEMQMRGVAMSIQETLDNVIVRHLLIQESKRQGLEPTREDIEALLEREGITKELLEMQGVNYEDFIEEQLKSEDIGITLLIKKATEEVNVTEEQAREIYDMQAEQIEESFEEVRDLIKDMIARQEAETQVLNLAEQLMEQAEVELFIT